MSYSISISSTSLWVAVCLCVFVFVRLALSERQFRHDKRMFAKNGMNSDTNDAQRVQGEMHGGHRFAFRMRFTPAIPIPFENLAAEIWMCANVRLLRTIKCHSSADGAANVER